jgi:transposase
MDMWAPYAKSTRENIEDADRKIVYDKFHVISHMNKAINEVRQTENRALLRIGDRRLVKSKWTWLKNEENMKNSERNTFNELRKTKLKTARARALGDMLKGLWGQLNIESARAYFEKWYSWDKRCRIEPIKKVAEMVKSHLHEILNYHLHRITNARAEGLNSKIGWIIYTARGFRSMHNFIIAVYFHCGCLQLYPR